SLGYTTTGGKKWKRVNKGAQYDWAKEVIENRNNVDFVVPVYHPAFYSSDRAPYSVDDRIWYKSLFTENEIKVSFCGHDHVYKKTHPIVWDDEKEDDRKALSDEVGIVEIGDG